jgi:hypothetical protein
MRIEIFVLFCLAAFGCGESQISTFPVSGTVLFEDGAPVRTGTVELESLDHPLSATGTIREDGSFVLGTYSSNDGACAGKHRAIVVQMVINDGTVNHTKDHGKPVDPIFASYNTSPLTATVEAQESNTLKLVVTPRIVSR